MSRPYYFLIKCPLYSTYRITYLTEILERFNLAKEVIKLILATNDEITTRKLAHYLISASNFTKLTFNVV